MTKYFGILVLIASLILAKHFETKISKSELIIADYIESESKNADGLLNYFKDLSMRDQEGDSIGNSVMQLYENIQNNDLYSKSQRNEILNKFPKPDNNLLKLDNISLFNKLCQTLIKEYKSIDDKSNCTLIIEQLELANNDSLKLKFTPITFVRDNKHIVYNYQNEIINRDQLIDFKGNIAELSAIISNPVTNELYSIEGQ